MEIHELLQGSEAWHVHRANHRNASDTPAVTGHSPYKSRSEFLKERATGIAKEIDPAAQRRFDDGHRYEALARPLAEKIIGGSLFPVTGTEGLYSASFDGLTMMEDVAFEHKTLNDAIRACGSAAELPIYYREQMEHQLMVSGAGKCLFMATRWNADDELQEERHFWYEPDMELRRQICAAWDQFEIDLANYQPAEPATPESIGQAPETLPALRIEVTGMVTASNLDAFKSRAMEVIGAVKTELKTDQDFADAAESVKWCEDVEARLEGAKQHALSQTESIDALFKTIDTIKEQARAVRLKLEKLVKVEKERRKEELVAKFRKELNDHYDALKTRTGVDCLAQTNFTEAIKGLKTLDSMRDKLSVALANAKMAANEMADRIEANRKTVEDMSLFPDFAAVCTKAPEDFAALLALRISQRQEAEAKRKAAEAEAAAQAQAAQVIEAAKVAPTPTPAEPVAAKPAAEVSTLPQADTGTLLKLGEISQRLGFDVRADFMESLGFKPVKLEKQAKLYRECDFTAICSAIVRHINAVAAGAVKLAA
jgi:putative phage-type endonuclease